MLNTKYYFYTYAYISYTFENTQIYICKSPSFAKWSKTQSRTGAPTVAFPFLTRFNGQIQNWLALKQVRAYWYNAITPARAVHIAISSSISHEKQHALLMEQELVKPLMEQPRHSWSAAQIIHHHKPNMNALIMHCMQIIRLSPTQV